MILLKSFIWGLCFEFLLCCLTLVLIKITELNFQELLFHLLIQIFNFSYLKSFFFSNDARKPTEFDYRRIPKVPRSHRSPYVILENRESLTWNLSWKWRKSRAFIHDTLNFIRTHIKYYYLILLSTTILNSFRKKSLWTYFFCSNNLIDKSTQIPQKR